MRRSCKFYANIEAAFRPLSDRVALALKEARPTDAVGRIDTPGTELCVAYCICLLQSPLLPPPDERFPYGQRDAPLAEGR